jgi:ribosomal-protein-alanine N-acetyltransferase
MHRITASYLPHNQRSGKLLKRLGFVVEGYAYDYIMINGKWEDHILTSLVNPNWNCY